MSHIKAPGLIGPLEVTLEGKPLSGASSQPAELQRFCAFYSRLIYSSLCCPSFVSPFSHPSSFFCVCFCTPRFNGGIKTFKGGRTCALSNTGKHFRDSSRRRISHDIAAASPCLRCFRLGTVLWACSGWEGPGLLCSVGVKSLSWPGGVPLPQHASRNGPEVLSRAQSGVLTSTRLRGLQPPLQDVKG